MPRTPIRDAIVVKPPVVFRPPAPKPEAKAEPYRRIGTCLWPIGDPGTSGFHFCDAPHKNRSYCDSHTLVAYAKTTPRGAPVEHAGDD